VAEHPVCSKCGKRPGTERWETADFRHPTWRCELCCVRAQVDHARERAAALPALESRLAELEAADAR